MNFLLWEDSSLKIEHCYTCAIQGYLIVSPKTSASALHELETDDQKALGVALAKATKAIEETLKPLKIYCASFGEEEKSIHFHVFPRTEAMTEIFLETYPEQARLIHGPVILDWAREYYSSEPEETWLLIEDKLSELRSKLYT